MATIASNFEQKIVSPNETFGSAVASRPIRKRATWIYAAIVLLGLCPIFFDGPPALKAAGLGLIFPGAGFLAVGGWPILLFPLTLLLMVIACAALLLMGNLTAPLSVWLVGLVLASVLAGGQVTSWSPYATMAATISFLVFCGVISKRTLAGEAKRRDARVGYLPDALKRVDARAAGIPAPGTREISPQDLASLRYSLDRGLQPVDGFDGFNVIEQFQTSAVRYQIDFLLWGLQVAQCHYTPNFHGYLSQAQRNLIDKLTVPTSWKWWRWENLFGNFSLNVDPIAKDNIMFGAFSSANIALYTAITGDDHYLQPGSLTFRWSDRKVFRHDLRTVLAAGRMNHDIAVYAPLYPCEPNLTYSACNLWGNIAHVTGDRLLGTNYTPELVKTLRPLHVSEMLGLDGSPHSGRVVPLGIRLPVYTCNFVSARWGWMAGPFFPDLSKRTWAVLREECVSFDENGEIEIATQAYDRVDTGNYRKNSSGVYAEFLVYAREQGDAEVAEAIERRFDRDPNKVERDGVTSFTGYSNHNNAVFVMGKLLRQDDIRSMVIEGPPDGAMRGPLLSDVRYPDVLVAKAFSHGEDLELVLYPGRGASMQKLGLSRLIPNHSYVAKPQGLTFDADEDGHAEIDLFINGRTELYIVSAAG